MSLVQSPRSSFTPLPPSLGGPRRPPTSWNRPRTSKRPSVPGLRCLGAYLGHLNGLHTRFRPSDPTQDQSPVEWSLFPGLDPSGPDGGTETDTDMGEPQASSTFRHHGPHRGRDRRRERRTPDSLCTPYTRPCRVSLRDSVLDSALRDRRLRVRISGGHRDPYLDVVKTLVSTTEVLRLNLGGRSGLGQSFPDFSHQKSPDSLVCPEGPGPHPGPGPSQKDSV